jgi:hypothetical protein
MCPDKADVNNPVRIIYPNNQSVFVSGNVENHSSIPQNAGASQISLDIGLGMPSQPSKQTCTRQAAVLWHPHRSGIPQKFSMWSDFMNSTSNVEKP